MAKSGAGARGAVAVALLIVLGCVIAAQGYAGMDRASGSMHGMHAATVLVKTVPGSLQRFNDQTPWPAAEPPAPLVLGTLALAAIACAALVYVRRRSSAAAAPSRAPPAPVIPR